MNIEKTLLRELPLQSGDSARLILELYEALGDRAQGLSRLQLLELLRRVARAGLRAVDEAERTVCFEEAARRSVEARADRRPATKRDLRHFVRRMLRVPGIANLPLRTMRPEQCRSLLQTAFGASLHSYRKGRAILHSIFSYGKRQGWCEANPTDVIEAPRPEEKLIAPLTLEEVRRLEATAARPEHRCMQLALHLMLYCGIRPTEVRRLSPSDIHWKERRVIIRPRTAKTGGGRVIPLRNARRLSSVLRRIPGNWRLRWRRLRRAAGFTHWQADALRHTFASYHAAHFRNLPALQYEMGHRDLALIRYRYATPLPGRAASFWGGVRSSSRA